MDASTATALAALAKIVSTLGPYGLGVLVLGIPLIMPLIILWMYWASNRRQAELLETSNRKQTELLEVYRHDTREILKDYGDSLDKVTKFYGDNVQLVQGYERVAKDLHDVVVLNTTTIQRCCDLIQNNSYCPLVRDRAGVKQL